GSPGCAAEPATLGCAVQPLRGTRPDATKISTRSRPPLAELARRRHYHVADRHRGLRRHDAEREPRTPRRQRGAGTGSLRLDVGLQLVVLGAELLAGPLQERRHLAGVGLPADVDLLRRE